jgi:hypothetical protein
MSMKKSVVCMASTRIQAELIVERLKEANFSNREISALFPDRRTTRDFASEQRTTAPQKANTGPVGGIAGSLVGLGIPDFEAKRYEGKIRQGGIFVCVHTERAEEVSLIQDIFTRAAAHDICVTGEAAAPGSVPDAAPPEFSVPYSADA